MESSALNLSELFDLVSKGGALAVLLSAVYCLMTEKFVPGKTYERVLKERDQYREALMSRRDEYLDELMATLRVADRATRVSERTFDVADSRVEAERQIRVRGRDDA